MDIVGSALYSLIIQTEGSQKTCHENTKAIHGEAQVGRNSSLLLTASTHLLSMYLEQDYPAPSSLQMTAP